ncbi:Carboxylesterase family-domain-containing protein [Tricharina praecox]|uniref:Carboxylesterase family-domain-containing protein n=1 Tax=Tricharina praecox TaxID=43433 RepID=UPI002220E2A2|nr:Carboxylesterase family-domain-containing protein [Tricharina praecox]KAI5843573.1 Carboxylesterase family-domain-containing protein [Tricharina praecox]
MLLTLFFLLPLQLLSVADAQQGFNTSELLVNILDGPVLGHWAPHNLRWSPPDKPDAWTAARNASRFGPACYNAPLFDFENFTPPAEESEGCVRYVAIPLRFGKRPLTSAEVVRQCVGALHIAPEEGGSEAAVMLWVYGGGFSFGGSYLPLYNGASFVRDQDDVILVTFNYRLGLFGFPGVPGDGIYSDEKNLGLHDVRAAIEWTYDNIRAFGGDPKKITLFGESSGSAATDAYLFSSASGPLTSGAILQSGTISIVDSAAGNHSAWANLTEALVCNSPMASYAEVMCLRAYPELQLRDTVVKVQLTFGPVVDDSTVFSDARERLEEGRFTRVPILIGSNDEEILEGSLATRNSFTCPAARSARFHAMYGSEVAQIFGTFEQESALPEQKDSSRYIQGAWAAFAKDALNGLGKYWPSWDGEVIGEACIQQPPGATFTTPWNYESGCNF